jgi:hypothetical protein
VWWPLKGPVLGPNVVAPKRGAFVAESSLRQPGGCGLEMPVGTRRVAETGGLTDGLLGEELAGSARCVREESTAYSA